jgi:hypothetical protein
MADIAAVEMEEGGLKVAKDLFAGAAGGIAQVLLGEFFGFGLGFDWRCCGCCLLVSRVLILVTCWRSGMKNEDQDRGMLGGC